MAVFMLISASILEFVIYDVPVIVKFPSFENTDGIDAPKIFGNNALDRNSWMINY